MRQQRKSAIEVSKHPTGVATGEEREPLAVAVRITAVGTLVSALEELSRPDDMHDRSLFSWPIRRTGLRVLSNRRLDSALSVFKHPLPLLWTRGRGAAPPR